MSATAQPAAATRHPNGVRGLLRFGPDPLRELERLRDDGRALVPFSLGPLRCHLLTRPDDIRAVLNADWPPLSRGRLMAIDRWYSGGLILTEGAEHDRQRDELWAPLVAESPGPRIALERAERAAGRWAGGEPVELFGALRALCWSVEWESLTGEEMPADLIAAQERGVGAMVWLIGPYGHARWSWPTPGSARTRAARRRLDAAIDEHIARRRAEPRDDLLSELVARADDDLVRATVKQWLGADQLHTALTWTLQLLADHPDVEERFHAEVDAADELDVNVLPYTRRVLKEALRLYPPIWGFFRELTAELRVGEQIVPAGHVLALSPWATHRDPRIWPDPQRFDPERWLGGSQRRPEGSYFPFSAGPYGCPGHGLAMKEAVLILAALGRRAAFQPVARRAPRPVTTGTVAPRGGLRMRAIARST